MKDINKISGTNIFNYNIICFMNLLLFMLYNNYNIIINTELLLILIKKILNKTSLKLEMPQLLFSREINFNTLFGEKNNFSFKFYFKHIQ